MPTATLSTKGQLVIPIEVRQKAELEPGDQVLVEYDETSGAITISRKETLREMANRLSRYIKPGTPPLVDVHSLYETREPRL